MKPQEMIDVIQAHANGKQIEFRIFGRTDWRRCDTPTFDFSLFEYRVKPAALRPHWPCICRVGTSGVIITDTLYPTIETAQVDVEGHGGTVIRLATEYPPVMLP